MKSNISLKHAGVDDDNTAMYNEMDDSMVLDSVPKSMRARAESVLKRLKNHPNMVSWNKSGNLVSKGKLYMVQISPI